MKNEKERNSIFTLNLLKYFIIFFGIGIFFILTFISVRYQQQKKSMIELLCGKENNYVNLAASSVMNKLQLLISDLMILANNHGLLEYLETGKKRPLENITKDYIVFSKYKQIYDQIRVINENGMEVVRVNYNRGYPIAVKKENLQNKKHRYYFAATMKLPKGAVFLSPFDLNVENQSIELPFKPMIRYGTPIFNKAGTPKGIVITNYFGQEIIDKIKYIDLNSSGSLVLLNDKGYWLKGIKQEDEWGFMFSDKKEKTFGNEYPEIWQQIVSQKKGQIINDKGIFSFAIVEPLTAHPKTVLATDREHPIQSFGISSEDYKWYIVSIITRPEINSYISQLRRRSIILLSLISAVFAIGAYFFARAYVKQQKYEKHKIEKIQLQTAMELAGAISHELNQPLQICFGYTQLLAIETKNSKHIAEKLKKIEEQLIRMKELSVKLLGVTRYQTKNYIDDIQILDLNVSSDYVSTDEHFPAKKS